MPRRQTEERRASHHMELSDEGVVSPPVCAIGVSLLARGYLSDATPRGQQWTSAVTLCMSATGCARRMAVLETFHAPALCRQGHHEFMCSAWPDLTPIIPAPACHPRNDIKRYSRRRTLPMLRGTDQRARGASRRDRGGWFTNAWRIFPARNQGTRLAGMGTGAPVLGLRPTRA
jgi:hypothetical protein